MVDVPETPNTLQLRSIYGNFNAQIHFHTIFMENIMMLYNAMILYIIIIIIQEELCYHSLMHGFNVYKIVVSWFMYVMHMNVYIAIIVFINIIIGTCTQYYI